MAGEGMRAGCALCIYTHEEMAGNRFLVVAVVLVVLVVPAALWMRMQVLTFGTLASCVEVAQEWIDALEERVAELEALMAEQE